ncbi:MAG: NAD(P)-dependent oxidoreductase [Syntrophales bacterium]|nr:NAD(P)-dependent oxidoreductase [Syntrophales bacterium]
MKKVGFIGAGIMGRPMAANLLKGGLELYVWNRTRDKCNDLIAAGAKWGESPAFLARECDVTFSMLADPAASVDVCFGLDGVVTGIGEGRGYIEMSTIDPGTARRIADAVTKAGGRFLEAPVSGSKKPAEEGTLIIMAAGDRSLYDEVEKAFGMMGKMSLYLGEVGRGAQMKLCVNLVMGGMMAAFCEGLALASRIGLDLRDMLNILDAGAMSNPMFRMKGGLVLSNDFPVAFPLKHMQKDLRLALLLADEAGQSLPATAVVNELFKKARGQNLGDLDFAALWRVTKESGH